ncbi:hypothetical protein [Pseudonocardia abyssalis]|uniref:Uncharacterized protein n=1 Tax=Pseudonocardia abyssalis TaxID=2792008 RepID=A0ABS6UYS0_9PSEU|nr:hypothetical protein [Pseudonocardia abyssalis]MBW0116966.1 hypothetical protein [Pseudonocardia abyssalis]MBW0137141.1 hypothetical protein [Pseudonocardia abyssalis]
MTTQPTAGTEPWSIPPLFAQLVDDTGLLGPRDARPVESVVARYLAARDGAFSGLVGQLVCPVSRLPELVKELARSALSRPVDLSIVVDTGLGSVPKALSTVLSRPALLAPRTVETAAPPDVDGVWLDRVAEFVPEDVVAVVEPRRPAHDDPGATDAWLDAVRRVADQGCAPKLRCGGPRPTDAPSTDDIERFVRVVASTGRGFTTLGLHEAVRVEGGGTTRHGIVNLLVAVARALGGGDVAAALRSTDGGALAAEIGEWSERAVSGVRGLLSHCGADLTPGSALAGLGLLSR